MSGVIAEGAAKEEVLCWPPKCRSTGSNKATPRRNRAAVLEKSVDGNIEAKDAKSRYLAFEDDCVVSDDVDGSGSRDAPGTPVASITILVLVK